MDAIASKPAPTGISALCHWRQQAIGTGMITATLAEVFVPFFVVVMKLVRKRHKTI
ncbi:hypothetical protein [Pseudomonas migulae]|uniref:Uncharacterized protein n=1 Tax=Pseudomonas migulae TaxID=78543 RepID=A0A1H5KJ48_9PSED|nr:hypothetical protein [Pseudomonas migulae]SEE64886.1 hypothetical protein SAMN04490194_3278 [Pseudomonas migulae]